MKRLKLLEEEKESLAIGLQMVSNAKQWYEDRLRLVQRKLHFVDRIDVQSVSYQTEKNFLAARQCTCMCADVCLYFLQDQTLEAYKERVSLQSLRIQELNQQLKVLVESHEKV